MHMAHGQHTHIPPGISTSNAPQPLSFPSAEKEQVTGGPRAQTPNPS